MTVEITPKLEALIQDLLRRGEYQDESEVLDEALKLLQKREELRAEIRTGIEELERGEQIDGQEVFNELRARVARHAKRTP